MFEVERAASNERLQEVRLMHQLISEMESPDPLQPEPDRVLVLRGAFFVLLYAYFESSVNRLVSATLNQISSAAVSTSHLRSVVYSLALNPKLMSLESVGQGSKWKHRVELFLAQGAPAHCSINDGVLAMYLQNIWPHSIEQVFACLGVSAPPVPSGRHIGYLNELVEKRNAVSHGRASATEVGRRYRSPELLTRQDAVAEVVTHVEAALASYLEAKLYVADGHRAAYFS
jgi:RiboL-PSP-HEPN